MDVRTKFFTERVASRLSRLPGKWSAPSLPEFGERLDDVLSVMV